ncbi:MAG: hypothetical protein AAFN77_07750 [Planctomycetota bacterium]
MALNVKQIIAIGLALGVLTAFGYYTLTRPNSASLEPENLQLKSIDQFELEPMELPSLDGEASVAQQNETNDQDLNLAHNLAEPKKDHRTDFESSQFAASSINQSPELELSQPMNEPLINSGYASIESGTETVADSASDRTRADATDSFDLGSLSLGGPDSELEDQFVAEQLDAPAAPELMQADSPAAMQEVSSNRQSLVQQTGMPEVILQNQPERSAAEPKVTKGWKSNPFVNSSNLESNDIVETNLPETSMNPVPPATVADAPQTIQLQPSDALETEPELTSKSVLSLMDDRREQILVEEPARDVMPQRVAMTQSILLGEADAQKSVHHIEYGKELSRRGAGFIAREEFLKAIQVIAVANDAYSGTNSHSQALKEAALIMKEAEDFAVGSAEQQIQMNVAEVVQSHRSNVLTLEQAASLSPSQAIDRYFSVAQKRLDLAGGRSAVSAEVFYCLGKLHSVFASQKNVPGPLETAKSVVFHQSALMSNPKHHRSANELGVLFAKNGRLNEAKQLFERSLLVQPHPRTWQNLATAHQRLGEHEYARRANNEFLLLSQQGNTAGSIRWAPIQQFNAESSAPVAERVANLPGAPITDTDNGQMSPESKQSKSFSQRLKELF